MGVCPGSSWGCVPGYCSSQGFVPQLTSKVSLDPLVPRSPLGTGVGFTWNDGLNMVRELSHQPDHTPGCHPMVECLCFRTKIKIRDGGSFELPNKKIDNSYFS